MSDDEGIFIFKNGNEYRGSFKGNSNLSFNKYGIFDGIGELKIIRKGTFFGKF